MELLVTVINKKECRRIIKSGCDILDIKNPGEGSLGAAFPWTTKEIKESIPRNTRISIAIGDIFNLPGTISLAVWGALAFSPDYIKVGLKGIKNKREAKYLLEKLVKTVKSSRSPSTKIVAAGYADYKKIGSICPLHIPDIASKSGVKVVMIDTFIKNGRSILDIMPISEITRFVDKCHKNKLTAAIAGSLALKHVAEVKKTGVDFIGVRGAVCSGNKRTNDLKTHLVRNFYKKVTMRQ